VGTTIARIDAKIQRGRGKAAQKLGQTYDIRRANSRTNIGIGTTRAVITGFPSRLRRITSKNILENQTFEILTFQATCDNRTLQLGDLATETGYEAMQAGNYIVAQMRPTRESVWVRVESNVVISRPNGTAGQAAQQPTNGNTYVEGWAGTWPENEEILQLVNGIYSFTTESGATPAQVPCGLEPNARIRDGNTLGLPTEQYRDQFMIYLPMLYTNAGGVMLNELDRINFGQSDRYEIAKLYTSDMTGLSGQICQVEKLGL
jgi:hypothetical protein